ncbi:YciI family protein [Leptolyngbya sp. AN02str]
MSICAIAIRLISTGTNGYPKDGGHRMKYLLLIYMNEHALSDSEREHCYVESAQLAQQLNAKGQYLATAPLHPVSTATSVRVRDGKPLVTDGPFAETREQLGGFFLINAQDLDEAIAIASQIPGARAGTVEIRPVLEVAGLPEP